MSKVYSFRLNNDNPREAKAREVIEAWVEEGFSLRYMVVEALLSNQQDKATAKEGNMLVEQLRELIDSLDNQSAPITQKNPLSSSFIHSVRSSAKLGLSGK